MWPSVDVTFSFYHSGVLLEYLSFKSVSQSGKLKKKKARFAIDGKRKKCAVTDKKTEPYWKGTLQSQSIVAEVQILNIGRGGYINLINLILYRLKITQYRLFKDTQWYTTARVFELIVYA